MTDVQQILVTGAAGKVGQAFIRRLLASGDDRFAGFTVRALCHNRMLPAGPRLEVMSGSIDQRETAGRAVDGVSHVLHLATSKETPETIIDVAVKGLFWLLEACRVSLVFRQFILIDAVLAAIDHPAARRQTFNICMDEPVDYGELGAYLAQSRGLPTVGVRTPYHSTWLDNAKAKFLLGWRPQYDLRRMADEAWSYHRAPDDPRVTWYPG